MFCGLAENDFLVVSQLSGEILNVGFFCSSYAVSYLSFSYAEYELNRPWLADVRKRRLSLVPVGVMVVLTLLTLKYKFFFYIDSEGNYIKGPFYVPMLLGAYSYILAVGIDTMHLLRKKQYYTQRKKIALLASLVVFPLLAGTAQAMFTGVSLICFGATIAMVQVFISLQETRITLDPLTHINNRTRMMQVLEANMTDEKQQVYFLMMDLDRFKQINDQYGHLEGDSALIELSHILMRVCGNYDGLLSRYGGDEFAVVMLPPAHKDAEAEAKAFCADVNCALAEYNTSSGKPYKLSVSIGWASRSDELNNIPALIAAADSAMYREKAKKHRETKKD